MSGLAPALATGLLLGSALCASAYEVSAVPDAGTLTGVVHFAGTAPRLKPVAVARGPGPDLVGQRRRLLDYLHQTDTARYQALTKKLKLRK